MDMNARLLTEFEIGDPEVVSHRHQLCDVIMEGEQIYGEGVNLDAHLESLVQVESASLAGFMKRLEIVALEHLDDREQ